MLNCEIIAVGRLRQGPLLDLYNEYSKRLQWSLTLHEIDDRKPDQIDKKILEKLNTQARIFILDERGKSVTSPAFANRMGSFIADGIKDVQFIIGGADGHSEDVRKKANFLLSFGSQTWPHMLARVMLVEQIYRAQQILAGHPYHRE